MAGPREHPASARHSWRSLACVATLFAASTLVARAEPREADLLSDSFYLSLGTFIVGTNTKVRVNGEATIGDEIDLEKTFGDSDSSRFRIDGYWRFADRHKLRFLWFDWNYSATRTLEEDIEFEGELYPVGARTRLETQFTVYELAYEYAFLRRQDYELTGSLGVHFSEFSTSLSARVTIEGETLDSLSLRNTARADAPLPVLGLRAMNGVRFASFAIPSFCRSCKPDTVRCCSLFG